MLMRMSLFAVLSVLALAGTADARPRDTGEIRLAKLLQGRVAGQPTNCIRTLPSNDMTVIDKTAIVFGHGSVIYVNRTQDPDSIDDHNALLVRKHGDPSRLCKTDVVTSFDPNAHFYTGNVMLTEFVPYRRVRR
jgi:hypothetical protein